MENPENLSAEELDQRKEEMKEFYDSSIPYLESQLKYEQLLTDVEEARFKRANFAYQWQMLMASTQPPEESDEDVDKPKSKPTQDKKPLKRSKLKRT
tara:strand:- start:330 stop:620 length:291 start_codon:yes stop_codon:yes gene_type:complete